MGILSGLAKLLEERPSGSAATPAYKALIENLQANKPKDTSIDIRQSPENVTWVTSNK